MMKTFTLAVSLLASLLLLVAPPARADDYDPLAVPAGFEEGFVDIDAADAARGRALPLRVYLPAATGPAPVILFSHGLGGARTGSAFLGTHWSARGYVVVFVQHPGSDEAVWQDVPLNQRMGAMRKAASAENAVLRYEDVPFVIDQLEIWNQAQGGRFENRFDLSRIGMSGHSFGARTTQALAGQVLPGVGARYTDPRIDAALPMSPSSSNRSLSPKEQFGGVTLPWLLMTGTKDTAQIGGETVEDRLAVFEALPPGSKYQLVLDGGHHHAFTDGPLRRGLPERDPDHHPRILALSTAFWDAYLLDDPEARGWIDGEGPGSLLDPRDDWRTK